MRRIVSHVASTLSAILGIAIIFLWVRSYRHIDLVTVARWDRYVSVWSCRGQLCVTRARGWRDEPIVRWPEARSIYTVIDPDWSVTPSAIHLPGLRIQWGDAALHTARNPVWSAIPLSHPVVFIQLRFVWPAMIALAMPLRLLIGRVRKRRQAGHCHSCSYDLTGNMSGVCPECGVKMVAVSK